MKILNVFSDNSHIDNLKSSLDTIYAMSISRTSIGILTKWQEVNDGIIYYTKTGTKDSLGEFSNLEPCSEIMAYRIASVFGFKDCVETKYRYVTINDRGVSNDNVMVSYTRNFLEDNQSTSGLCNFFSKSELLSDSLYNVFLSKFPNFRGKLDEIILFDFITLNTDRHLNNISFIVDVDNNIVKLAPIYDNGASLLSQLSYETLSKSSSIIDRKLKCKPFNTDFYRQIKNIDITNISENIKYNIQHISLDWNDIFLDLDIGLLRKDKIKECVERRLNYVKGLLCEV